MKQAKRKETFDGSRYSTWQVLDSANAYYELSTLFTSKLAGKVDEPVERNDLAVASATNRILALELYLKAMLIASGTLVPKDHDLKNLFDALPEHLQAFTKEHFDSRVEEAAKLRGHWEVGVYFGLGTADVEIASIAKVKPRVRADLTLEGVLVRSRHGFVVSRYLFQEAKRDQVTSFIYEHRRLAILCSVLCEGLENSLSPKQQGYKRHFQF